jgi:hypothetical protein
MVLLNLAQSSAQSELEHQNMPRLLLLTSFPINSSLNIPPFNAV